MSDQEPGQPLRITSTAELLKAVELGIVDKTEARGLLGLPVKRGRLAKLQPRQGGRFARGDEVLPFNRFTATAREALTQAQDLASTDGRAHVETADMLLAVIHLADGAGARALRSAGVGEEQVRAALSQVERNEVPLEGLGPTLQLKGVVETAFHAVQYPNEVGTQHLVLALAAGEGAARAVLAQLGASEPVLRAEIDRISAEDSPGVSS